MNKLREHKNLTVFSGKVNEIKVKKMKKTTDYVILSPNKMPEKSETTGSKSPTYIFTTFHKAYIF